MVGSMNQVYWQSGSALSNVALNNNFNNISGQLVTSATYGAFGTYTGDGGASKQITGIPFDPKKVIINRLATATWISFVSGAQSATQYIGAGVVQDHSDRISYALSGGFQLDTGGADPNGASTVYYYFAQR